jgi:hypothetical protein
VIRHASPLLHLGLLGACAAALAGPPSLGVTAGGAWPTGSTRETYTDSTGWNLGAFADWEQRPGHTLRLALDGNFYPASSLPSAALDGANSRGQSQSLTANYVFTPTASLQGFYLLMGAGAMNFQRRSGDLLAETGVKLAWNVGLGVDLGDRWGLQARYQSVRSGDHHLGQVIAGLTYRF